MLSLLPQPQREILGVFSRQNDAPGVAPGPTHHLLSSSHPPYVVAPSSPLYR